MTSRDRGTIHVDVVYGSISWDDSVICDTEVEFLVVVTVRGAC